VVDMRRGKDACVAGKNQGFHQGLGSSQAKREF